MSFLGKFPVSVMPTPKALLSGSSVIRSNQISNGSFFPFLRYLSQILVIAARRLMFHDPEVISPLVVRVGIVCEPYEPLPTKAGVPNLLPIVRHLKPLSEFLP